MNLQIRKIRNNDNDNSIVMPLIELLNSEESGKIIEREKITEEKMKEHFNSLT